MAGKKKKKKSHGHQSHQNLRTTQIRLLSSEHTKTRLKESTGYLLSCLR